MPIATRPARLLVVAALFGCVAACPAPHGAGEGEGEGEGEGAGVDTVSLAEAETLLPELVGLWSGPATQTPLGNFPVLNMDVRDVDGHTIFSRTDLDHDNSLRFSFEIEDHNGPLLVFRNGGFFQGVLRDSRTGLVSHDGSAWRFCSLDRGCDYIDATWTATGDELTLQANVLKAQHVTWSATRAETRTLSSHYPVDDTSQASGADFPLLSSLTIAVSYPALANDADVWVFLSTTACGQTFSCTVARQIRADAAAGSTSTSATIEQLHPDSYEMNVLLDRDRNFTTTLRPSSGDGVAVPDQTVDVAGDSSATSSIVFTLP